MGWGGRKRQLHGPPPFAPMALPPTYPVRGQLTQLAQCPWAASPGGAVTGSADELAVHAGQELALLIVEPGVVLDRVDHGQRPERDRRCVDRWAEAEIAGKRSRLQAQYPLEREHMVVARRGGAPLPLGHRGLAHADQLGQRTLAELARPPRGGKLATELLTPHRKRI